MLSNCQNGSADIPFDVVAQSIDPLNTTTLLQQARDREQTTEEQRNRQHKRTGTELLAHLILYIADVAASGRARTEEIGKHDSREQTL